MKTSQIIITDTALHIKIPHLFAYELGEFTLIIMLISNDIETHEN